MTKSALALAPRGFDEEMEEVGVPSASAGPETVPAPVAVAGDGVRLLRFKASLERLQSLVRRSRASDAKETGFERLFCGLCLLSGVDFPLRQLLAALPVEADALDADGVLSAMGHLGFHATSSRMGMADPASSGARLLVTPGKGALVVFRCPDTGIETVLDAEGRTEAFDRAVLTGQSRWWSFKLNSDIDPLSKTRRTHTGHSWFRALLARFDAIIGALLIVSLAVAVSGVMLPVFTIQIYAHVISLGSLEALPLLVVGMMLVIALEAIFLSQRTQILAWTANRLEFLVSVATFERILKIRPSISERAAVTDQAARLRTFENVREFITGTAFTPLLEAPASALSLAVIGFLAGWLTVIPMVGIAAHLLVFFLLRRRAKVLTSIAADESTEMQRIAIETFEKRDAIRLSGLQHLWADRMINSARRQQDSQLSLRLVSALGEALSTFILTTATIVLLAAGAQAVWRGELGTGGLLAMTILGMRSLAPSHMLCLSVQRFEQLRNSVNQLNALMDIAPERDEKRDYMQIKTIGGAVSFLNTGFRASDTRPVFIGLDIEIERGGIIAITGANGTGKTTVLKLVQGLSDLSLGAIRLDGIDLRQLPQEELRRRISYVPQNPRLFPGTLRDNLLFANPLASDARLWAALGEVGLTSIVTELEGGLDHRCGNATEEEFSIDFRFKFAFAQAILVESNLFLIDEIPNMLLDGAVGEVLKKLIASSRHRCTVMFVSHRIDFLKLADRIVALNYGKVPSIVTPDALLVKSA